MVFLIFYRNLDFVLVDEVSHGLWNCIKISTYIFDFSISNKRLSEHRKTVFIISFLTL